MLCRIDGNPDDIKGNPFTGEPFDDSWILFALTGADNYQIMCGKGRYIPYAVQVSRHYPHWRMALGDFIGFHEARHDNMLLSMSEEDLQEARRHYARHRYDDRLIREYEPAVLVHSTPYENWQSIQADGCLKSWHILQKEKAGWEPAPIGRQLGDPAAFSNYVMLSNGSVSGEIVVLSKQHGQILMNEDMPYTPGVRLYFDMQKIAGDGLLVRDGLHLKVENRLPLQPYLLWYATWDRAGLVQNRSTPREYTEKANAVFRSLFPHMAVLC